MPQEECKGGDCELRPQFEEGAAQAPSGNKKVRLSTSKYVQLLIDARETDPDCWPPGLEAAAAMVQSAAAIEADCIARWGEFDPGKLPHEQGRKYLEIQLALDTLQEEAGDSPLDIEGALSQARHVIEADASGEPADDPAPARGPSTMHPDPASRAEPSESFFASEQPRAAEFFLAGLAETAEEILAAPAPAAAWIEMPPPQRGDYYA